MFRGESGTDEGKGQGDGGGDGKGRGIGRGRGCQSHEGVRLRIMDED